MVYMSSVLAAMDEEQRQAYYAECAVVALAEYDLGALSVTFVQHNAGIVYRIVDTKGQDGEGEAGNGEARYLLKTHESAGDWPMDTAEQLRAQMAWLQALSDDGRVVVQTPIANRHGDFVSQVQLAGLDRPSSVCVQRWITAHHMDNWDEPHARAIGVLLATLHSIAQEWPGRDNEQFGIYDARHLVEAVQTLAVTVELGLISAEEYALIGRVGERIVEMLAHTERTKATFGLIHGDLHQGNVLFEGMQAVALDYGTFRSYFLYDLGVSLYHATFDPVAIRHALVAGYASLRPLSHVDLDSPEAYMIMAALFNLAFQATLQEHRLSAINRRNMRQFVEKFCRPFDAREAFLFEGRPLTMEYPA